MRGRMKIISKDREDGITLSLMAACTLAAVATADAHPRVCCLAVGAFAGLAAGAAVHALLLRMAPDVEVREEDKPWP